MNSMSDGEAFAETGAVPGIKSYESLRDKVAGVLLGSAVGDSLGWPTEFLRSNAQMAKVFGVNRVDDFLSWDKPTGGRFNTYIDHIRPGDYSDDTQLTLCTARCIRADGTFDVNQFAKTELPFWRNYARGAGATITRAAHSLSRKKITWDNNFFSSESKGRRTGYVTAGANGAAMRIAPIALANAYQPLAIKQIWKNSVVTHGHPRAIWGALVYASALLVLLNEENLDLKEFMSLLNTSIESVDITDLPDIADDWKQRWEINAGTSFDESFETVRIEMIELLNQAAQSRERSLSDTYRELGCFDPATKGSGSGTVAASIGVFLKYGANYERAVLETINMVGSDTDTIAAMAGGLICARLGEMAIPDHWANTIQDYPYFHRVADALTRIALRESSESDLTIDHKRETFEPRNIVSLVTNRQVQPEERVTHPIFGLGWVEEVKSQPTNRKDGGTMLLARVAFDIGQSCVFRSYQRADANVPTS